MKQLNNQKNTRVMLHISLHFIIPAIVAVLLFRNNRQVGIRVFFIMAATMIVDVDHLLATPIYDPLRCSIGFHPLHQVWPMVGYTLLTLSPKTRFVGVGLMIHMALDSIDCMLNTGWWWQT